MRSRYIYDQAGNLVYAMERGEVTFDARCNVDNATHHVMPDIKSYQSMADGTMITSRSQHREHLKRHGLIEIGNETQHLMKMKKSVPSSKPQIIEALHRAKEQYGSRHVERAINESLNAAYELRRR